MTILIAYLNEAGNGLIVFESTVIADDAIRVRANGWNELADPPIPTGAGGVLTFYQGDAPVGSTPVFSADLPDGTPIDLIRADTEVLGSFVTQAASGSGGVGAAGP